MKTASLDTVPPEVIYYIITFLDLKSLLRCASINREWCALCATPALYKEWFHILKAKTSMPPSQIAAIETTDTDWKHKVEALAIPSIQVKWTLANRTRYINRHFYANCFVIFSTICLSIVCYQCPKQWVFSITLVVSALGYWAIFLRDLAGSRLPPLQKTISKENWLCFFPHLYQLQSRLRESYTKAFVVMLSFSFYVPLILCFHCMISYYLPFWPGVVLGSFASQFSRKSLGLAFLPLIVWATIPQAVSSLVCYTVTAQTAFVPIALECGALCVLLASLFICANFCVLQGIVRRLAFTNFSNASVIFARTPVAAAAMFGVIIFSWGRERGKCMATVRHPTWMWATAGVGGTVAGAVLGVAFLRALCVALAAAVIGISAIHFLKVCHCMRLHCNRRTTST